MSQQHCICCFRIPAVYGLHGKANKAEKVTLRHCSVCFSAAHCSSPGCVARFTKLHTEQACERYLVYMATKVVCMQFGTALHICSQSRLPDLRPQTFPNYPVPPTSLSTATTVRLIEGGAYHSSGQSRNIRLGSSDTRSTAVMPDNWAQYLALKRHDFDPEVHPVMMTYPFTAVGYLVYCTVLCCFNLASFVCLLLISSVMC